MYRIVGVFALAAVILACRTPRTDTNERQPPSVESKEVNPSQQSDSAVVEEKVLETFLATAVSFQVSDSLVDKCSPGRNQWGHPPICSCPNGFTYNGFARTCDRLKAVESSKGTRLSLASADLAVIRTAMGQGTKNGMTYDVHTSGGDFSCQWNDVNDQPGYLCLSVVADIALTNFDFSLLDGLARMAAQASSERKVSLSYVEAVCQTKGSNLDCEFISRK